MRNLAIAVVLSVAAPSLGGCKSQKQVQREDAADLEAQYEALNAQYKKECYDPLSVIPTGESTKKALSGEWNKTDAAAAEKAQADTQARIASAYCQTLAEKRKDVGNRSVAAMHPH